MMKVIRLKTCLVGGKSGRRRLVQGFWDWLFTCLGETDGYNQIVAVLHHRISLSPDEVALLVTSLKALSGAVMYIDNVLHESLLASAHVAKGQPGNARVGHLEWVAVDVGVRSVAASNGKYIDSCLEILVCNFTPPYSFMAALNQPRGSCDICGKEGGIFGELVRSTLLSGVVDLLIDLDVEIGWDDILQDDSTRGIFKMELELIEEATDDEFEDGGELPREPSRKSLGANQFAEKLDCLLVLTFEHLESCEVSGRLIQILKNCGARFATVLTDIFVSNVYPPLLRMRAVAYLASYLSRGKFLSTSLVTDSLQRLLLKSADAHFCTGDHARAVFPYEVNDGCSAP
ncbi:hypothetical protein L484_012360 [Morus notabilis]|uniref:Uncharacterized protein n=1 Tax=Morus notabilis TaxID=981085 RepID=W9SMR5_9ROSA|nr:hypothetical protein L484_012360 [Morus notabilis]